MKEASPVKFYFAKYFFLAFGLLQWLCGMLLFLRSNAEENEKAPLLFFIIGLTFIALYFLIASKLRRVAFSKKRIIVMNNKKSEHYEWPEVKSIKMIPYFNLCKLKLRGKKDRIYFLPDRSAEPLFGLYPTQPELVEGLRKKVK
ncbi:MAG: hypothetical protein HOP08_12125 [Cyclobacteriaceae bacterium]|nr:hypothetical protein [Cyclobacteriaceae bacterium]